MDGSPQNKLNVHAQEFQMNQQNLQNQRNSIIFGSGNMLQHSKSSSQMQQLHLANAGRHHGIQMGGPRPILVTHPMQMGQMGMGMTIQSSQMPLVNSPSSGNILHVRKLIHFYLIK